MTLNFRSGRDVRCFGAGSGTCVSGTTRRISHWNAATLLALAVIACSATASAQAPDWQVSNPASFDGSMSVTAIGFIDGVPTLHPEDVLAAFSGAEVRGISKAMFVKDDALFFLTIFGDAEAPVQNLTFKIYDAALDQVRDINESTEFAANAVLGELDGPYSLSAGSMGANRPSWAVTDPGSFEQNMNVTASVVLDGVPRTHPGNMVAAFVDGELRGVATPVWVTGRQIFFLSVLGNTDGEPVSFRQYDAMAGQVRTAAEAESFVAGASLGTIAEPHLLTDGTPGVNRPSWEVADAGSFEATMSVAATVLLDGVASSNTGNLLATFSGATVRGVSSPRLVNGVPTFFLTVFGDATTGSLTFDFYDANTDTVVDIIEQSAFETDGIIGSIDTPLGLTSGAVGANAPGWSVDEALYGLSMSVVGSVVIDGQPNIHPASRIGAFVGEELRGAAAPLLIGGRSLYFLTVHANGVGEPITFRAYDAATDRIRGVDSPLVFDADELIGSIPVPYLWRTAVGAQQPSWPSPDSMAFGLKMTLLGRLLINDEESTHPDNVVAAFAGDELRGSSLSEVVDGHLVFPMTIYANAAGEAIRFEAYDAAVDRVRPVLETIVFAPGAVTGTPADPVLLSTVLDPPQASPALLSPADGEIDVQLDPTLVWDIVPRAVTYEVELATSEDFGGATVFGDLASTSLPLAEPLALSTTYFWHARAVNTGGPGPWSKTRQFTTRRPSVSNEGTDELPARFTLAQNHPNPFNPGTEIRYDLASAANVRLAVHDVLGRVVRTLVNGVQPAGSYTVAFDAGNLSSGLYLYRIEAGTFVATRSMTILK